MYYSLGKSNKLSYPYLLGLDLTYFSWFTLSCPINFGNGGEVLGSQYDKITYIPQQKRFLIEKDGKVGIYDVDEQLFKITISYDELMLIDEENKLYLAKDGELYGVIDINGNTKIVIEYDKIGIDVSKYGQKGLKSGYILLGDLIPVQKNNKWSFYKVKSTENEDGTKNVRCEEFNDKFDEIGCVTKTSGATVSNIVTIEEYNVVVVKYGDYYGLMKNDGGVAVAPQYTDIYMETSAGKTNYFLVSGTGEEQGTA